MDELEKNIPDDFWRKAFDDAAETPPPRVWDSIERQLNESNDSRIIPLWGSGLASSRPLAWGVGIAAALALLVVGWWAMTTPTTSSSAPLAQSGRSATTPVRSSDRQPADAVATVSKPSKTQVTSSNESTHQPSVKESGTELVAQVRTKRKSWSPSEAESAFSQPSLTEAASTQITQSRLDVSPVTPVRQPSLEDSPLNASTAFTVGPLTGKPLRMRSLGPIQRIVWFQPTELPQQAILSKEKRKSREKWVSASVIPGSFNPTIAMQSAYPTSTALMNNGAGSSQSAVNSRANFSVAYQASAGVQLNERWSVESGIGYLAAHSTVEAPAQSAVSSYVQGISADRYTVFNNLYVDALRYSSSNKNGKPSASSDLLATSNTYLSPGSYSNQMQQTLINDYQYMQVPIQVGYQLRPRKRLSLALLGGFLTNIFVRNTVGNDIVVTGKDGVYRPVSLAASLGARFRYRPSGRWSASLAGLYQPSLNSATQSDSQIQSHPTSAGMSFGVDYHF